MTGLLGAVAALGLVAVTSASTSHAQPAPPLGTTDTFGVLAGAAVTNIPTSTITGTAALPGNVGAVSALPASPIITGPGITEPLAGAVTFSALSSLSTAYNYLAGLPAGVTLTGQNLGGLTLVPGVYNFSSSAQLTGNLTLNALGNSNAVFIINVGSTLTTASASTVTLINGAQGGNVFWRVGSSATLGTTTSFTGDILALASVTLDTGAKITCGAAWAETGSVTLDANTIKLCNLLAATGPGPVLGPTGLPLLTSLLPSSATSGEISVANAIDNFVGGGGTLPLAFLNLFNLTPSALATALTQLEGGAATGAQESGFQMTNSFLSLLTNPFTENRGFAPPPQPPLIYKGLAFKAPPGEAAPEPRRWSIWAAAYGGGGKINGDPAGLGSNNLTTLEGGFATGLDYLIAPDTLVGFALAGGGTSWSLSGGLGGGRSDVFQAGVYGAQRFGAAYFSGALTYASYWASTSRTVTVAGPDTLSASFIAQNFGGRLEGGYRLTSWAPFSVIPYAAVQAQAFYTPGFGESGSLGAPDPFALAYNAQTATQVRSELGSRFDQVIALADGSSVVPFGRAAWAHDWQSNPNLTAAFLGLPGTTFTAYGAAPPKNLALVTAGAEWRWRNGWSVMAKFDGEFANGYSDYMGTGGVRYSW